MYWSNWGFNPCIERSAMDGSDRHKIITQINKVNGLTIDYIDRRIFWIDIEENIIESADLTGRNRQQIISTSLARPHALTQYENSIYWSDWTTNSIERAEKITGENQTNIQKDLDVVIDIGIYHISRQPGWNPCAVNNGGCSHLCLILPNEYKLHNYCCACPNHYELALDNKTCLSPKNFILFSQKNIIGRMIPNLQNTPDVILPIPHLKNVRALEYDDIDKFIYWIDGQTKTIRKGYDNGTKITVVVHNDDGLIHPFDIAIEQYSRCLYWSCAENNVINVTKLNGTPIGIIINGEDQKPRHIAINQNKGLIFWTNLIYPPRIECSALDGSNKQIIIKDGLKQPGALTIDVTQNLIFWSDLNSKTIETADMKGFNRKTLVRRKHFQPVSLTVLNDHLYWIDIEQQVIEQLNILNEKDSNQKYQIQNRMTYLTDIIAVSTIEKNINHPCLFNNGGCSHLCMINEKGEKYCSCPVDLMLDNDNFCINAPTCNSDQFNCQYGKTNCIPVAWRCDGSIECDDMLDELNCTVCKSNQYKCKNDKCIDRKLVCDGIHNCPNGEDELCCEENGYYCNVICTDNLHKVPFHCKEIKTELMKMETNSQSKINYLIGIVIPVLILIVLAIGAYYCKKKSQEINDNEERTDINLSNKSSNVQLKSFTPKAQPTNSINAVSVHYNSNNSSSSISLDHLSNNCQKFNQNHMIGDSISKDIIYPKETLNPPPSPITVISQSTDCDQSLPPPPPPTPSSTEISDFEPCTCEKLSYNNRLKSYNSDPLSPTSRNHYFSDDDCEICPPLSVISSHIPSPPPSSPVYESDV